MREILEKIPYFSYFESILRTATFRESSVTFFGTVANGAFGAVFFILAARFLGPADFGLLSVAIAALTLIADIGDLGTDTGLVNFVSRYIKKAPKKAYRFLKLGLEVKFLVWIFMLVVGLLTARFWAQTVFARPELETPIRIAFVGVGFILFFSFITHALQAFQRFWSWSLVQVGTNALRVVLVIALLYLGFLTLESTMWLYIAMPLVGFLIGIFIISPKFLKVDKEFSIAGEFFKYNGWVAAFTALAALSARLDTFISARLLTANELGLYSAANQMVRLVPMIVAALGTVIAPKMAEMGSVKALVSYLKKTQAMVLGLAGLGLLSIPVVLFLIPILFGAEYVASGPLFIVLLIGMLFFLIAVPVHMAVFYYYSYPKLFFWISLGHLAIIAVVGWFMISAYGPMGGAITVVLGNLFNFVVPAIWVIKNIRRSVKTEHRSPNTYH